MTNQMTVWNHIAAAPHRSFFLVGALQGILALLWWVFDLSGRYAVVGTAINWNIAPIWAHAFLMIYGFFPFFIFGFLFTTYPNWMNGEKVKPREYMSTCLLMLCGVLLFYIGLVAGEELSIVGVAVMLIGWSLAVYVLLRILFTTASQDKRHAKVTSVALLMGWFGLMAYLLWLITGNPVMIDFSSHIGIWFFLVPIVLTVSHRMIPFFSSRVLDNYVMVRPFWLLWFMLGLIVVHGCLQLMEMLAYLWILDLPLALCAFYLSYRWGWTRSFRAKLLAVLHISFTWFAISMVLYGLQSLIYMQSGKIVFGLAPLHALAIGFFTSMILAMTSRVTLGHAGRPLELDRLTWILFLGFQAAAILRIIADVSSAAAAIIPQLYIIAGLIWLFAFALWAIRYVPIYWRPRVDGKQG